MGLRDLALELFEIRLHRGALLLVHGLFHLPESAAQHGPAERLHPRVDRRRPLFLHLRDDRDLVRRQRLRDVVEEVLADAGVVDVEERAERETRRRPDGRAHRSPEEPDQASDGRTGQRSDRSLVVDLLEAHGAVRVLHDHRSFVDREVSLALQLLERRLALKGLLLVVENHDQHPFHFRFSFWVRR